VLLGEEKSRPALLEDIRSNQSLDRAVSLGHVQAGRLVIFVGRQWILAERDESSHNASRRTVFLQFVTSPAGSTCGLRLAAMPCMSLYDFIRLPFR
jgi:hypothetical protein